MKVSGPLALEPILVPKPWGGHRLEGLGKALPHRLTAGTAYGESWEVADLPDDALSGSARGRTLVASGPHRGKSLRQLIAESGSELLGSASPTPAGDFPLLFKLLDTAEHLSIQVHPGDEYAARRRGWFPQDRILVRARRRTRRRHLQGLPSRSHHGGRPSRSGNARSIPGSCRESP